MHPNFLERERPAGVCLFKVLIGTKGRVPDRFYLPPGKCITAESIISGSSSASNSQLQFLSANQCKSQLGQSDSLQLALIFLFASVYARWFQIRMAWKSTSSAVRSMVVSLVTLNLDLNNNSLILLSLLEVVASEKDVIIHSDIDRLNTIFLTLL